MESPARPYPDQQKRQISKNGKPVAISAKEYESNEALKLYYLQSRAAQAKTDIDASLVIDGDTFFNELDSVNIINVKLSTHSRYPE